MPAEGKPAILAAMFLRFGRRPLGLAVAFFLAISLGAGCEQSLLYVDVPAPDAGPPPLTLTFVTPGPVALPFGTRTTIEARLLGPEGPVAGEEIGFALDGSPAASSLEALAASTDGEGVARVLLRAGDRSATYRVRANHPLASAVWLDVTVAASFGRLAVHPVHTGDPVQSWTVGLFTGVDCARARMAPDTAARSRAIPAEPPTDARFDALATDRTYTVLVRGSTGGRFVASGCVMGVGVLADTETTIDVPIQPLPLVLTGSYQAQLTLDGRAAIETLLGDWISAATTRAGGASDDATRLVAALEVALAGDSVGLAALARVGTAPLASALVTDGSAPSFQLGTVLGAGAEALRDLRLEAALSVSSGDVPTLTAERLVAEAGSSTPLVLSGLAVEPIVIAATYAPETRAVVLDRLSFPLPLGASLAAVLDAQAVALGLADRGELLGSGSCATLESYVASDAVLDAACDAACRADACAAGREATLELALSALADLDAARATVELSGTLGVRDEDRDLAVDALSGTLEGTWGPTTGPGEPVTGTFAAARPFG